MEEQHNVFDFGRLVDLMLSNWRLILIITLLGGFISFGYTYLFVIPQFEASVTIYVNNTTIENRDRMYTGDLDASKQLVETYITIIKSDAVLEKVAAAGDNRYSASQIRGMLTAASLGNTEIFKVSVRNTHPQHAAKIANLIAAVAPDEIANFVNASSVKVIDYAKTNPVPVSPNYLNSTAFGMLIGLIVGIAFVLLRELLDIRIKSPHDLELLFELPLLGIIPEIQPRPEAELHAGNSKEKGGA